MRRVFLMMSILYFLRSITMYVTVLPVSSTTYYCSPKSNATTVMIVAKRTFQLLSGFGLSINGKHTYCGDYIYSGHTVMLVLGYLVITECKWHRFCYKYNLLLIISGRLEKFSVNNAQTLSINNVKLNHFFSLSPLN